MGQVQLMLDRGSWQRFGRAFLVGAFAAAGGAGCGESHSATESTTFALNLAPKTSDFVIEAQNSVRLQTGAIATGADIGARGTAGPFLGDGAAVDILTGAQVQATHNIIGSSVNLGTGAKVGDIQASRLTVGTGSSHGTVSALVALPALPATTAISPGTTNVSVATGATSTVAPGAYASVTVGTGATLKLTAGGYDMSSLTLSTGAKLLATGAVVIRVAGRVGTSSGVAIGPASGSRLTAGAIRLEVSGQNGTTGALTATPAAASFGTGNSITALVLVPNGSLVLGTGTSASGAFFARDVDVSGSGASINYQDGFPNACTVASCSDGNPCTVDTCRPDGACTHAAASAGASCSDGNVCNGAEACDGAGSCRAGTPVTCSATDQCHLTGACDPTTGACTNPPAANGIACNDGNACTRSDTCEQGLCVGHAAVSCAPLDQCHSAGVCTPATGVCSNPGAPAGTPCAGGNVCDPAGACVQCLAANTCPGSDSACAARTCTAGTCGVTLVAAGAACGSGLVCDGGGSCVMSCVPTTCSAQGKNCGSISDGCGGTLNCGTCAASAVCGGTGTPNVCGVVPTNCEQVAWRRALTSGQTSTALAIAADSTGNVYVTGRAGGPGEDALVAKVDGQGTSLWTRQLGSSCPVQGTAIATSSTGYVYVAGDVNPTCALPENTSTGNVDMFLAQYDSAGNLGWVRQFGSGLYDAAYGVATDQNGDVYVVGDTGGSVDGTMNDDGAADLVVIKYSADGSRLWARQLGSVKPNGAASAAGRAIATDGGGNVYVAGASDAGSFDGNTGFGQLDLVLVKFDTNGNKAWSRQYGTTDLDFAHGVATDPNGNVYVTGQTYGRFAESPSDGNVFVVKYDGAGSRLWTRQRAPFTTDALGIATDHNDGVFIAGETSVSLDGQAAGADGDDDPFVIKYNSAGDWIWTQQDATPGFQLGVGVATGPDGSVFAAGDIIGPTDANGSRRYDAFVTKIEPAVCGP